MSCLFERVFKIYDEDLPGHYEVGPDFDELGLIEITEYDRDGVVSRVSFGKELAKYIIKALQETLQEETK